MLSSTAAPSGVTRKSSHRRQASTPTLDGPIPLSAAAGRRAHRRGLSLDHRAANLFTHDAKVLIESGTNTQCSSPARRQLYDPNSIGGDHPILLHNNHMSSAFRANIENQIPGRSIPFPGRPVRMAPSPGSHARHQSLHSNQSRMSQPFTLSGSTPRIDNFQFPPSFPTNSRSFVLSSSVLPSPIHTPHKNSVPSSFDHTNSNIPLLSSLGGRLENISESGAPCGSDIMAQQPPDFSQFDHMNGYGPDSHLQPMFQHVQTPQRQSLHHRSQTHTMATSNMGAYQQFLSPGQQLRQQQMPSLDMMDVDGQMGSHQNMYRSIPTHLSSPTVPNPNMLRSNHDSVVLPSSPPDGGDGSVLEFAARINNTSSTGVSVADAGFNLPLEATGITSEDVQGFIGPLDPVTNKWPCLYQDCGKLFGRKENIRSHIQTHLGDRQYVCQTCEKAFVRQHDLKRHAKIHTGKKPYPCPCGRGFARHDALTRHRQRGMCVGAFEDAVRKPGRRGRRKKVRDPVDPEADEGVSTSKTESKDVKDGGVENEGGDYDDEDDEDEDEDADYEEDAEDQASLPINYSNTSTMPSGDVMAMMGNFQHSDRKVDLHQQPQPQHLYNHGYIPFPQHEDAFRQPSNEHENGGALMTSGMSYGDSMVMPPFDGFISDPFKNATELGLSMAAADVEENNKAFLNDLGLSFDSGLGIPSISPETLSTITLSTSVSSSSSSRNPNSNGPSSSLSSLPSSSLSSTANLSPIGDVLKDGTYSTPPTSPNLVIGNGVSGPSGVTIPTSTTSISSVTVSTPSLSGPSSSLSPHNIFFSYFPGSTPTQGPPPISHSSHSIPTSTSTSVSTPTIAVSHPSHKDVLLSTDAGQNADPTRAGIVAGATMMEMSKSIGAIELDTVWTGVEQHQHQPHNQQQHQMQLHHHQQQQQQQQHHILSHQQSGPFGSLMAEWLPSTEDL